MGLSRIEEAWTKCFKVGVCEQYLANEKDYSGRLRIWKRHKIRSIGMVCGRC